MTSIDNPDWISFLDENNTKHERFCIIREITTAYVAFQYSTSGPQLIVPWQRILKLKRRGEQ